MQATLCPKCGREIPGHTAADCRCVAGSGTAAPWQVKPPPPPELAGRVFTPTPPEIAAEYVRTFNEEEYLAATRELERTGGVPIDDLIAELERRGDGSA